MKKKITIYFVMFLVLIACALAITLNKFATYDLDAIDNNYTSSKLGKYIYPDGTKEFYWNKTYPSIKQVGDSFPVYQKECIIRLDKAAYKECVYYQGEERCLDLTMQMIDAQCDLERRFDLDRIKQLQKEVINGVLTDEEIESDFNNIVLG